MFTFTSILILTQLIKAINKYMGKGISIFEILYMVMLFLPSMLIYVCPIVIFCATIFSYHRLITDNEVVILEANGLSKNDLAKVFFKFSFLIVLAAFIITTIINPLAKREFNSQKLLSNEVYISGLLEEKVFNNVTKNMTIYIESKDRKNNLKGVLIFESTPKGDSIITAESASLANKDGKIVIFLNNGTKMESSLTNSFNTLFFKTSKLNLSPSQVSSTQREYSSEEWLLPHLINSILSDTQTDYQKKAELQKRFVWPLLNLSTSAIAILGVAGMTYSRRWESKNIIICTFFAAVSLLIHFALEAFTQKNYYLSLLVYANPLIWYYISRQVINKYSHSIKFTFSGYLIKFLHRATAK